MDYTYNNLVTDCDTIVEKIKLSGWFPDYIVGVTRGGLIPAVCLSHKLGLPLETVQWSTRDFGAREIAFGLQLKHDYTHKKLLIVDDIIDNGLTMSQIKIRLPQAKTAALIYNNNQTLVEADYFGSVIDRSVETEWINFWWEKK
jgi:hypoxanthine phosphoribosyltransferase